MKLIFYSPCEFPLCIFINAAVSPLDDLSSPLWLASSVSPGPDLPPLECKFLKVQGSSFCSLTNSQGPRTVLGARVDQSVILFRDSSYITSVTNPSQPFQPEATSFSSFFMQPHAWVTSLPNLPHLACRPSNQSLLNWISIRTETRPND